MTMKNPSHPGSIVLRDCIEALNLTIAQAAEHLQMPEKTLAAICRCEAPITADAAIRFEMAFGSTARAWLAMQAAYDLAQSQKTPCRIKRIERAVQPCG